MSYSLTLKDVENSKKLYHLRKKVIIENDLKMIEYECSTSAGIMKRVMPLNRNNKIKAGYKND